MVGAPLSIRVSGSRSGLDGLTYGNAITMTFPHENEDAVGETAEKDAEKDAYEAAQEGSDDSRDHAVGGTEGTTDGQ